MWAYLHQKKKNENEKEKITSALLTENIRLTENVIDFSLGITPIICFSC